jgi:hypothetical protein
MPIRYLLDEHLRGPLWDIILRHNSRGADLLDATRVGDEPDLPTGASDPEILIWAERERRVLVSEDKSTMAAHLSQHLAAGRHSPGVFTLRPGFSLPRVLDALVLAAHASEPAEWEDQINWVP